MVRAPGQRRAPRLRPAHSLVVTPAVVAHRGASGYRPEHTLEAYRTAIRMGVDDIELDLVCTADGVLLARHDVELSLTTDVADHREYADRHRTLTIDGVEQRGWFVTDFTHAEVKRLTARERRPAARPHSAAHDGRYGVPTLNEVLAMVEAESVRRGRMVGVMLELKHASWFDSIGLGLAEPLLRDLARHGVDHARSRVSVMSFEPTILRTLAGCAKVPLIQLLDAGSVPADFVAANDPRTYADLVTPAGLAWIERYADGLGVHVDLVLARTPGGMLGEPTSLVRDAHAEWLTVHTWTLRAENATLPVDLRIGADPHTHGDLPGLARRLLDAGVDGLITDHPDLVFPALSERT